MISNEHLPITDLQPVAFRDFVAFIDRSATTTKTYTNNLRQFAAWLNMREIRRPTRRDILAYRDYLAQPHEAIQYDIISGWRRRTDAQGRPYITECKAGTIAQYLRSVSQFFRWTAAEGIYPNIADNIHAPKIHSGRHKRAALRPEDVLAIETSIQASSAAQIDAARTSGKDSAGRTQRATEQGLRLRAIYLLGVTAGLRTIEMSRARVRDLETEGGSYYLWIHGKGHSEPDQRLPIATEVYAAIDEYLTTRSAQATPESPLFVSTGNRSGGRQIAPTTISTILKSAMRRAGYDSERITAHSLRHTAGTTAQRITGNIYLTQRYMRHSDPATTEVYLHIDTEDQAAQIAEEIYRIYHNGQTNNNTDAGSNSARHNSRGGETF